MRISLATQHANAAFTPLALLYLKAYAVEHLGFDAGDIAILEFDKHVTADAIAERILASTPDVVGLSCYVWNIRTLMAACATVKARRPQVQVVIGGPEVGPIAASVIRANPAVDVVVRSEGEMPFTMLVDRWQNGGDIGHVNGVTLRRDGTIFSRPTMRRLLKT